MLAHWQLHPQQLIPVLALAVAYRHRAQQLAIKGRAPSRWRQVAFYGALMVLILALVSPLDWLAEHRLLYAHMIQHLLLGDVAPLLAVLGCTGAMLRPLLGMRWLRSLRALAHPLIALPLWAANLYFWHLPALYQAALRDGNVHALQHFCFFSCGALMWAAVIEPLPGPAWFGNGWKTWYTLAVRGAGMLLANVFIWAGYPFYSYYATPDHAAGISPLSDQRIAGAIMFIEGSVVTMLAFAWLFIRFTRETELRQRLVDRNVDEAIAARSARYGRSARLRDVT